MTKALSTEYILRELVPNYYEELLPVISLEDFSRTNKIIVSYHAKISHAVPGAVGVRTEHSFEIIKFQLRFSDFFDFDPDEYMVKDHKFSDIYEYMEWEINSVLLNLRKVFKDID